MVIYNEDYTWTEWPDWLDVMTVRVYVDGVHWRDTEYQKAVHDKQSILDTIMADWNHADPWTGIWIDEFHESKVWNTSIK